MQKIKVLDKLGKEVKNLDISKDVLSVSEINKHVIFDSVNVENQNKRQGTHDTKNKSEVSGTGKKPYKQKHTGRARQGSKRNPQFRGGGIAFGVTSEKNYKIKINKKVSKIALVSVWQEILRSQNLAILDESFSFEIIKTKKFNEFLKNANLLDKKILFMLDIEDKNLFFSARNISNVICREIQKCSVRDLMNQNFLLITSKAFEKFEANLKIWK